MLHTRTMRNRTSLPFQRGAHRPSQLSAPRCFPSTAHNWAKRLLSCQSRAWTRRA